MGDETEAHEGHVVIGDIHSPGAPDGVGLLTLRFVRYPGAQQLILWLPQSGCQGYSDLTVTRGDAVVEQAPVRSRLNGSVQILFDTLTWPPGDYSIIITHEGGWRHEASLRKFPPEVAPPPPEPTPTPEPSDPPIVYRDGAGKVIPDVDLEIRAGVQVDLERRFGRRVEYSGTSRVGEVIYIDPVHRIVFPNEMRGGDTRVSIVIPSAEAWESETGAPLSLRDEIIAFVAARVQQDQASTWRYRITDTSIDFHG